MTYFSLSSQRHVTSCRWVQKFCIMRITLRKFVSCLTVFTITLYVMVTFTLHARTAMVYESDPLPWEEGDKEIKIDKKRQLDMGGLKFHDHVQTPNIMVENKRDSEVFALGAIASTQRRQTLIWPSIDDYDNDRILNQLKFKPMWLVLKEKAKEKIPLKRILLYDGFRRWQIKEGREALIEQKCLVNTCTITENRGYTSTADAILFTRPTHPKAERPLNQIWILYFLESPYHTPDLNASKDVYNWTATYRHDSQIVAPYEKFVYFDDNIQSKPQHRNYALGKNKKVAWFVSNCHAKSGRSEYVDELSKYIQVDVYGGCGRFRCPRKNSSQCFDMLNKDYKFYLSFENSKCRDYITEKFFVTGLKHDVIPIVLGAAPEDYKRAAPPHSYIHVEDFDSPKELAEYLHKLDQNDDLYNEYFQWKGTGDIINTYFWCRICGMLHDDSRKSFYYRNINDWWRGEGVCIGKDRWKDQPRNSKVIRPEF